MRKFVLSLVAVPVAALVVMGATPAIGAAGDALSFEFDDLPAVGQVTTTSSSGTAGVNVQVVSRDGGQAFAAEGRSGSALRLPAYVASTTEPRAVLRITNATSADTLSPGSANFAFGATARLDAQSQGTSTDNGNNLVQRGLHGDVAQYKLSLDSRIPTCVVKGNLGRVVVRTTDVVNPDDWYSLLCTRNESTVTLTVDHHHPDGTTTQQTKSVTKPTGAVTMASPTIPMSVGGKLNARGAIVRSTDQFNGVVDDVFLRITT